MERSVRSAARGGLAAADLVVGRLLAERDGVTFRAQGTCMYPAVRPGDVLRIRPCPAAGVAVGDVAVCRRNGELFGHRVVAAGERDGRAFVVTRPDRTQGGDDGPSFDEDLLGVVESVTRRGARVSLQRAGQAGGRCPLTRLVLRGRLALIEGGPRVRGRLERAVAGVQSRTAYRRVARRAFAGARPRLSYVVHVPLNATLGDAVYGRAAPDDFDPDAPWHGRVRDRWTLVLSVGGARLPAATATFVRAEDGSWRPAGVRVRRRYGGLGLERILLERADAVLARSGARETA